MLHYLGPNIGPGPVVQSLPPAVPGTMPQSIPGVPPVPAPLPAIQNRGPGQIPPNVLAAISQRAPNPNAPGAQAPPPPPQYGADTQEDGSILLFIQNPDGSKGPIVKVIPPIKRPETTPA